MNISQDLYIKAWNFATIHHGKQKVPGSNKPYINHIGLVTMETMCAIDSNKNVKNPNIAVICAILHDVIEDTLITYKQIKNEFGQKIANGVMSLTKNYKLKSGIMEDSLKRIKKQPIEIWVVKMADRITNLQPPPANWPLTKIKRYANESVMIHNELFKGDRKLSERLLQKIEKYVINYCMGG